MTNIDIPHALEQIKRGMLHTTWQNQPQDYVIALFTQNFGLHTLTNDQVEQLISALHHTNDTTRQLLQNALQAHLPQLLTQDFIWKTSEETYLSINPTTIATNTFIAFWTILSYVTKPQNLIPQDEELKNKFAFWLRKTKIYKANLEYQDLSNTSLVNLHLPKASFAFANLQNTSLAYANMPNADFSGANLQNTQISKANLNQTKWIGANLTAADISHSQLNKAEMYGANMQQVQAIETIFTQALCKNSSLKHATIIAANFTQSDLSFADLSLTNATRTNFAYCNLQSALLTDATLYETDFTHAKLQGADLRAKTYLKAKFENTDLTELAKDFIRNRGAIVT